MSLNALPQLGRAPALRKEIPVAAPIVFGEAELVQNRCLGLATRPRWCKSPKRLGAHATVRRAVQRGHRASPRARACVRALHCSSSPLPRPIWTKSQKMCVIQMTRVRQSRTPPGIPLASRATWEHPALAPYSLDVLQPSNAAPGMASQILRILSSRESRREEVKFRELISQIDYGDDERYQVHVALPGPGLVPLW